MSLGTFPLIAACQQGPLTLGVRPGADSGTDSGNSGGADASPPGPNGQSDSGLNATQDATLPGSPDAGSDGSVADARGDGPPPTPTTCVPVVTVTQFQIADPNSIPSEIAVGPDGNLWFSDSGNGTLGRITPFGAVTEFPLPLFPDASVWEFDAAVSDPDGGYLYGDAGPDAQVIAWGGKPVIGPDGNLWSTGGIGLVGTQGASYRRMWRTTPAGETTSFPLPAAEGASTALVVGGDGNLWYALNGPVSYSGVPGNHLSRLTPSGVLTAMPLPLPPACGPIGTTFISDQTLVNGPNGDLWFVADQLCGSGSGGAGPWVGEMTTAGVVTQHPLPVVGGGHSGAAGVPTMAVGADGNVWVFANASADPSNSSSFWRMTPSGDATEYPMAPAVPGGRIASYSMTLGPDKNVWAAVATSDIDAGVLILELARIAPSGDIARFPSLFALDLVTGPDGNLWATNVVDGPDGGSIGVIQRISLTDGGCP